MALYASGQLARVVGVSAAEAPVVASPAPDFTLTSLIGDSLQLTHFRGKPVLINFWATWCAPCLLEMPNIQKYYEKYPGQFEVLAVNAGETERTVQRFVDDLGVNFKILLDPDGKIQELYRIKGYPTTYIVDKDGIIRFQHIGLLSEKQIEEYLDAVGITE
jgi:thiol-disulfide isomerase/thioredoxin